MARSSIALVSTAGSKEGNVGPTTERPDNAGSGKGVFLDQSDDLAVLIPIGPYVGRWKIRVSTTVDRQISALQNPVKLVCKGVLFGAGEGGSQVTDFEYEDLWIADRLGSPNPSDPTVVEWVIEDNRRWAQGLKSLGMMNGMRLSNEFEEFDGIAPENNFGQYNRIPKFSYMIPTCRGDGIIFSEYDNEDFKIWTAFEAVQWMMTRFFSIPNPDGTARASLPDGRAFIPKVIFKGNDLENGFPLQDFSLDGPWPIVIARLLRLAHLSFVTNSKGEWVVFSLKPHKFNRKVGEYSTAGHVVRRDRHRTRSRSHRTIFKSRYDFRVDVVEDSTSSLGVGSDQGEIFPIVADNVVIMPFTIQDKRDGGTGDFVRRGTIVKITEFFDLLNADAANSYPPGWVDTYKELSLNHCRRYLVGPTMASLMTVDVTRAEQRHPRGAAIAKCLYDFYRKLYQIPKHLKDTLTKLKAVTSDVADTRTGKPAPSRVYFDHTLVLTRHGAFQPGSAPTLGAGFMTVRPWPQTDTVKRLDTAEASDYAKITVYDQAQGLFLISELTDIEGHYGRMFPHTFTEFPQSAVVGVDGVVHFLEAEDAVQDLLFRAAWVFSAEVISPNLGNFFVVSKPVGEEPTDGLGPIHEHRMRGVYAGFPWNDDFSAADIIDGSLVLSGFNSESLPESGNPDESANLNQPYNTARLQSVAKGLRSQHYFEQQDWIIGTFKAPGFSPEIDTPAGNYTVGISHTGDGMFEAVYNASQPRAQPIFEFISKDAADLLFRFDEERS